MPDAPDGLLSPDGESQSSARDLVSVRVGDRMRRGLVSCQAEAPLRTVARTMAEEGIHCVTVHNSAPDGRPLKRPWGVITVLDLMRGVVTEASAQSSGVGVRAGDIALSPTTAIYADDTLSVAAERMSQFGTSHLIVLDRETDSPVGVIAGMDIAAVIAAPREGGAAV